MTRRTAAAALLVSVGMLTGCGAQPAAQPAPAAPPAPRSTVTVYPDAKTPQSCLDALAQAERVTAYLQEVLEVSSDSTVAAAQGDQLAIMAGTAKVRGYEQPLATAVEAYRVAATNCRAPAAAH